MRRSRRWLRALLAPVLALCLLPLPAARAATAAELQAAAYSAYYDFLQAEISRIGIIGNCEQYFKDHLYDSIAAERPKGLLYAKLIDFDNSGVDELLIVKVDDDDPYGLGITDVRLQVYAYSGGKAVKIAQPSISDDYPDFEFTLTTGTDGRSYLREYSSLSHTYDYDYYTVVNGQWVKHCTMTEIFVPDIEITPDIHSSTGHYLYERDDQLIERDQYYGYRDQLDHTEVTYSYTTLTSSDGDPIWTVLPSGTVTSVMNTLRPYASQDTLLYYAPPASWAAEQVNAAIAEGIVPASLQNSYAKPITRAEFCALAVNFYEKHTGTTIPQTASFSDTSDANVRKMASIGVVNGIGGDKFAPNQPITREQAAVILGNLASAMDNPIPASAPTFADNAKIAGWASAQVGQMQASGIMGGVGSNRFNPQGSYTREQSIVTIMRMENRVAPLTGITLDQATITLREGQTQALTAIFTPANATDKRITWSSSAEWIATVSDTGLVTAVREGEAVITVKAANGLSAQCQVQVQDADYLEVTATLPATVNCLAFRRGVPKDEVGIDYLPDDPVIAATLSLEKIDISPYFTETDDGRTVRNINISGHVTALEPDLEIDFYPYLKWIVRDEAGAIVDSEMTVQDWGSYAVGSPIRFRISVEGMTPGCTYTIEFISDDGRTIEEATGNDTSCRPVGLPYTYTKSWSDGTTTTYTIQEAQVVLEYDPQDDDFEAAITFSGTVEGQENIAYSLPFYWAIADENGALVYTSSSQIASREIQEDGSFTIPPRAGSDSFSLERDHSYTLIFGEERFIK